MCLKTDSLRRACLGYYIMGARVVTRTLGTKKLKQTNEYVKGKKDNHQDGI